MSVNTYFLESIRQHEKFKAEPYGDGGHKMTVAGFNVHSQNGQLYVMHDKIPEEILEYVDYFSGYEWLLPERAHRETGVYTHEDATAEVELVDDGKRFQYRLKLKAKKKESLDFLLRLIKTGKIRPTESYEGSQQGMSHAELEALLGEKIERLLSLKLALLNFQFDLDLSSSLCWLFCRKTTIARKIREILADY